MLAQAVAVGLIQSGFLITVALGFSLAWRVTGVINLAHGEMVMYGAYLTWLLFSAGWLAPLSSLLVVVPAMFAAGYVMERLLLRRLTVSGIPATLLGTLGLSVALQQAARLFFSPTPHIMPLPLSGLWRIGTVEVAVGHAALLLLAVVTVVATVAFLRLTRLGARMRAVAQNAEATELVGIDVARTRTLGFAVCAAIAGAAGVLISQYQPIHPAMGSTLLLSALAITALAGPGNVAGVVVAGAALAMTQSLIGTFVLRIGANLDVVVAAVVLVVMLAVRRFDLVGRGAERGRT
jgi:branched-subunit amino acid ABC-type transport system permease component